MILRLKHITYPYKQNIVRLKDLRKVTASDKLNKMKAANDKSKRVK
jgi:hypothetical protein